MNLEETSLAVLREHLPELLLGPVFSFVGLCAIGVAAIRRRSEYRILLWFGLFIGMYGVRILAWATSVLGFALNSSWPHRVIVSIDYMLVVPGLLFWVELSIGKLRQLIELLTALAVGVGILSLSRYFVTGQTYEFLILNNVIAICMVLALGVVIVVPRLSRRYLVIQNRVLTIVLPAIGVVVVFSNTFWVLHREPPAYAEPVAFGVWVLALGYIAVDRTFENERRLLSIENELAIAREIQASILPSDVPKLSHLRISAAYCPMTAVAGDFYWFIAVDPHRAGFLVADVSGHGVPAALIASMIKVAMQSAVTCANDPQSVLRGVERALSGQQRGQFVSAAYLWLDTENRKALYSAAGHPPLLRWSQSKLESIQSNGLIFGVKSECDYPVREISIAAGDRFSALYRRLD